MSAPPVPLLRYKHVAHLLPAVQALARIAAGGRLGPPRPAPRPTTAKPGAGKLSPAYRAMLARRAARTAAAAAARRVPGAPRPYTGPVAPRSA